MLLADEDIEVFGPSSIALLKSLARESSKKRSRICFTRLESGVQDMIICLLSGSYVRPHRHPKHKMESYHVIEGALSVRVFKDDGVLNQEITLSSIRPYYRLKNGWYHQPIAAGDYCIYHEVYEGPFKKEIDVQYADWADEEV